MDPDEISRKAEEERQKEKLRKEELAAEQSKEKIPQEKTSFSSDSFKVYAKIFPSKFKLMLWIFFALGLGAVQIFLWVLGDMGIWALYSGSIMVGAFLVRLGIEQLRKIFTYGAYKNFRKNSPFEITGWEKLGTNADLLKAQYWAFDSSVEVITKEGTSTENIQRVNDALQLFISEANKHFYEGRFGSDGRAKWSFNHVLKVTGSADTMVIGEMYRLMSIYLKSIYTKYPVIKTVKVVIGDRVDEVKPPLEVT
jgi:hypothetical protein